MKGIKSHKLAQLCQRVIEEDYRMEQKLRKQEEKKEENCRVLKQEKEEEECNCKAA